MKGHKNLTIELKQITNFNLFCKLKKKLIFNSNYFFCINSYHNAIYIVK